MPYSEDFTRVQKVIQEALLNVSTIHHDPLPVVGIASYDSHNVVVSVRPYIDPDMYWDATYESYAVIKKALSESNVQVAYSEGVEMGDIGL